MSKKVGKITNYWNQAKEQIQNKQFEEARVTLDTCLLILALATEGGVEILDKVRLDLWKDRIWLLLEEKELLRKIMVPIIRADFCISDLYKCSTNDKISSRITAFGGYEDYTFPLEHLLMWKVHSENFSYELFKGGHFFTKTSYKDVILSINKILEKEINCGC